MSATDPTEREIQALSAPPAADPQGFLAAVTAPSAAELARLQPRRAPRAELPWRALVPAAMLLLAFIVLPRGPGPVMLEQGQPTAVDDGIFLGRDIRSEGTGTLRLIQAGARGTIVELLAGELRFDVNPEGLYNDLTVHAGGASFVTQGAAFTLSAEGHLSVISGVVLAGVQGEERIPVTSGARWHTPDLAPVTEITQTLPADEVIGLQPDPPAPEILSDPRPLPAPPQPRPPAPEPPELEEMLALEQAEFEALLEARAARSQQTSTLADRFLERWADSPMRPEVEAIALSAAMSDPTLDPVALLARVDRWLSANPKHPRFVEMHYLRATLLRDQLHDCQAASVSYRVVIAMGSGALQEQSQRYLEACQQSRGGGERAAP